MAGSVEKRWLAVAAWIAVIYTAIPFVRSLRDAFVVRWPAAFIGFAVMGIVAAAAGAVLVAVWRRRRRVSPADVAWCVGIAAILIVWTRSLMGQPEEAVHFLEYGTLGVLLYRALRLHIDDAGVFVAAALLGTIVGTVDEIIQWIVPDRYWDFRDLALNGGASVLVQIAVWRVVPGPFSPLTRKTARVLCRLTACLIAIVTLCLAATPQRLATLARVAPALGPLATGDDVMCEYGFLHRLDDRSAFRSRLSRTELADQDRTRAPEAAALLDRSRERYGDFLRSVRPSADPFVYEARVHVFARNRSLAEALRHDAASVEHRRSMTTAARENRILEKVFGTTVARSAFKWSTRQRGAVEAAGDPGVRFVSRVAGHLITWASEPVLRAIMVAAIIALVAADLFLGRRVTPPRNRRSQE